MSHTAFGKYSINKNQIRSCVQKKINNITYKISKEDGTNLLYFGKNIHNTVNPINKF